MTSDERRVTEGCGLPAMLITCAIIFFVWAGSAEALQLSPTHLDLKIDAGSVHEGSLVVTNPKDETVHLHVQPGTYRALQSPHAALPNDLDLRTIPSCAKWIQFEADTFSVGPHQSVAIFYTITVPANWTRESVASIVFDKFNNTTGTSDAPRTEVEVIMRLSIPVYVSIKGHDTIHGEVSIESVRKASDTNSLKIQSLLINTGPRHFRAIGTASVFAQKSNRLVNEQPTGQTLPVFTGFGEYINVHVPLPPAGRYLAIVTMDLGGDQVIQDQFAFTVTPTGRVKTAP